MPGGGMPGGGMPGGGMPGGGMPGGSQPGDQSGDPSGGPQGQQGSAGSGQSVEDLDQALDDSLDGFDDAVGGSGKSTSEIDILSPSGSSGMEDNSDEPLFEAGSEGAMAEANAELENALPKAVARGLKALKVQRALRRKVAKLRANKAEAQPVLMVHRVKLCQSQMM